MTNIVYKDITYTFGGDLAGIRATIDDIDVELSSPQYSKIILRGRKHTETCDKNKNTMSLCTSCTCGLDDEANNLILKTGMERLDFFRKAWDVALKMHEPIKIAKEEKRKQKEEKLLQEAIAEDERVKKLHCNLNPCKHCGTYCYGDCQAN